MRDIQQNFQSPTTFAFYKKLLKVALFCFGLMSLRFTFFEVDATSQICYLVMVSTTLVALWMVSKPRLMAYAVFVTSSVLVLCFCVLWISSGGVYGAYSVAYFTIMILLVALMPRKFKVSSVLVFCLLCLVLSVFFNEPQLGAPVSVFWESIDYMMNFVVLGVCIIYIKKDLESERATYAQYNMQIDRLTRQLFNKRKQLLKQRQQIEDTKNNLELIIEENTVELRKKNELLSAYAYSNAHILRAPLSNILGLIHILEKENKDDARNSELLAQLKIQANALDDLVREVNQILK